MRVTRSITMFSCRDHRLSSRRVLHTTSMMRPHPFPLDSLPATYTYLLVDSYEGVRLAIVEALIHRDAPPLVQLGGVDAVLDGHWHHRLLLAWQFLYDLGLERLGCTVSSSAWLSVHPILLPSVVQFSDSTIFRLHYRDQVALEALRAALDDDRPALAPKKS
jgi:hypothetical protein